jgi:hypothetical protein
MKTKTYDVVIEAVVTKTIRVNAIDSDAAYDLAHEMFTVMKTGHDEHYDQNTLDIYEVSHDDE